MEKKCWHLGSLRRFTVILLVVVSSCSSLSGKNDEKMMMKQEKQRLDGWYNNLAHPEWGAVDSTLTRKTPPSYADGVYMMAGQDRPSPRLITEALMKGADGQPSVLNRTAMFVFFGQVVSFEIVMASESGCPIEMQKIEIERCDHMYDKSCKGNRYMPFHRAGYKAETGQSPNNPREQVNAMTSWIDASFIYSTSEPWINCMRTFENGTLRSEEGGALPVRNEERVPLMNQPSASNFFRTKKPERMFLLGDPRSNQNPGLLSFGILFFRYHNEIAKEVQEEHPDWTDEDIFQKTKRKVAATLQSIIAYEFIPALLQEELATYTGYKPEVHPGVSHVFQSAAFRFSHTLIPPGLYLRNNQCQYRQTVSGSPALRLCSTWWGSEEFLTETSFEELLLGMSSQLSEKEDPVLCSDVRDKLFGPLDFTRRDLGALNIMRGRDNGLPDYNVARKCFDMPMISNWTEINPKLYEERPEIFANLERIYGSTNNIDLYVGGMLETVDGPGPLFTKIIKTQFENIRDADRFWFENKQNGIFSDKEIEAIRNLKLHDVIIKATNIKEGDIQKDVFFWNEGDPCQQPEQLTAKHLDECVLEHDNFDYFSGSEVAYIYSCVTLAFIPIIVASLGYGVVKLQNKRRRKLKIKRDEKRNNGDNKSYDKMYVREWLHQNHKRWVKIKLGSDESLSVVNRKGVALRKIHFKSVDTLVVQVTQDYRRRKPMVLVNAPKDYDLVLEFDNIAYRKKFLSKLENVLTSQHKDLQTVSCIREQMLANAETKERRQKKLEHFFREAYSLTFGLKPGERRHFEDVSSDVIMVMRTSLSKKEFAEALGMKPESLFVKQMFNCVDKDGDGRISFQEFLDTIVLFSKGKTENKLRIIFDMCDNDGNGVVDKQEFANMLHSLVDIAKTNSLTDQQTKDLIQGMFAAAGLEDKDDLSYDDFKLVMKEYKGDFIAIGLDCKGAKQNFLDTSTNVARMTSFQIDHIHEAKINGLRNTWDQFTTLLEEYRQHIFYTFVFITITLGLFFERFFYYWYMSEHKDLRHVMGLGIAITRGSAASLTFAYSILLLSICRNLITKLQELPIHQYIPLTSNIQFHKFIALTALIFTVIHTVGHIVNFYHVSTQPVEHLHCLSKEIRIESNVRPTVSYWLFQTITGITGVMLYTIICVIFIFAHSKIRDKAYKYFWATHSLYVLVYILCIVHGLGRLTGTPRFWMFFIGPGILFALDRVISIQTKFMELDILDTELLPSDVTMVKFYRPPNFKYLSGQWVRLSCTAFKTNEYHSLTLTSAPHENYLSVHIKAKGPWTWKLRNYFDPNNLNDGQLPKIRLEGPFGCGNQDWYKFEIAVMVGGGIGVTPYASILNDLVFGTSTNRYSGVACKKVYFLWICPSHRSFEWFIDVLRDVERKDVTNVLEMHIFITQFFHKFDLRTTMLYICENHFQRISGKSMFTGLKAVNHFGRPDMASFLKFVQKKHSYISKVGVFSCGPSTMTKSVTKACETVNKTRKLPYFIHHFENFG